MKVFRVLDRNNLFEKKNYKISLEIKVIAKIVRNIAVMDNGNWNYQISLSMTAAIRNSKMSLSMTTIIGE